MTVKDDGPGIPSPQDLTAFAKEYYRAYMEAVDEKKPQNLSRFAQDAPYNIRTYLLPNGSICMLFNSSDELRAHGGVKDWDEVQDEVVKGVDHFSGFFPFEGRSLGDWSKRGKRDALRDFRLLEQSDLATASVKLEGIIENITKMIRANPWLGRAGNEIIASMRDIDTRVKGGFPTVDAIASLQSLKAFTPTAESITIDFPDKALLEEISDSLGEVSGIQGKLEVMENRMFEIEKAASAPDLGDRLSEHSERVDRLEKQLEKVSNILTMLNSKVEAYFSKTAERERQGEMERRLEEHGNKVLLTESKIVSLEKEAERLVSDMKAMTAKMEKDVHDSRKRIARMEKHFVDFAKMVQE
jgi:chaperonin cofactor prefoldin